MSNLNQKTLKNIVSFDGVGLHTGIEVKVRIMPEFGSAGLMVIVTGKPLWRPMTLNVRFLLIVF